MKLDNPPITADVNEMHEEPDINKDTIIKEEIKSASKDTKNGKTTQIDNIPVELLLHKADITTIAVNMLQDHKRLEKGDYHTTS